MPEGRWFEDAICLWLLPFYPTPNRDNGYDISQYLDVDRRHGDLDDFIHFVRRAKEHGLRVMTDLVVNYTSDKHPWFQAACNNARSRFRDFYMWSDGPPPTPAARGPSSRGRRTRSGPSTRPLERTTTTASTTSSPR